MVSGIPLRAVVDEAKRVATGQINRGTPPPPPSSSVEEELDGNDDDEAAVAGGAGEGTKEEATATA